MTKFLMFVCCCLAASSSRAGLLTGELSPPTGSSYYSGYNTNTGSYSLQSAGDTYNTALPLDLGSAHIGIGSTTLGFGSPLPGGFAPLGGGGPYRGHTTSISHQTQSVPIGVPQPYPVTVHHQVPVPVPVAQPIYKPRPVPVEVLQPYPVSVPRPYPVTVAKPVPVPVRYPVYVKVPQAVPVAVPQPYPVHVHRPVPVKVPAQIVVNVPLPVGSTGHGYNTDVGYGSSFGLGAYGQGGYLSGNEYSAPHVPIRPKYTTSSFPIGDMYAYRGGFGLGGSNIGVQTKYTHGLSGGLVDGLKAGRYTDGYKIYKDFGHHDGGGGGGFGFGGGSFAGVNLADVTIRQQYDADGGYKY